MKKILELFFVSLEFILFIFVVMINFYSIDEESIIFQEEESEYNEFYPIINQFVYENMEEFKTTFIIESPYDVVSIDYDACGFIVINEPELINKSIVVYLKSDGSITNPSIKIIAMLSNNSSLSTRLYGIIENNKLYLNRNSFDAARDIYYSELLKNGIIGSRGYEKLLMNNNKESIHMHNESNNEVVLPRSSTGGWVTGTVGWIDDWNNWHPLQYTKVSIYDEDQLIDEHLGTVYTDNNGDFNFSFDDNVDSIFDNSGRDIFIKIWPEGINSVVKSGNNNDYVIRSDTYWDVITGSITQIDDIDISMNSDLGRAFQVSQAIITCSRYASAMRGTNMESVSVRYPHNESSNGCYYQDDTVYIIGNSGGDTYSKSGQILHSYASWDVIMHEYGHFVQDKLNIEDNPGGKHWSGVNMYDHYMSHHNGGPVTPDCGGDCANPSESNAKTKAIKIAYAESWPTILAGMAQQYYINLGILDNNIQTIGDSNYESYKNIYYDYNVAIQGGEAVEKSIMGVLWDIYDSDVESYDDISLGHNAWWNLTVVGSPKTFSAVVNHFYSLYSSYTMWDPFDRLLEYFKMSPENIETSHELVSHSLPTFSWTPNGTSSSLENNSFRIMIYDSSYSLLLDYYTTNTSTTLTQSQWDLIMSSSGSNFYVTIGGSQTNNTSTGYYYSALKKFDKPVIQTTILNGTIQVIGFYNWTPNSLVIKSSYNGLLTTSIGQRAFKGCTSLEEIVIPSSVNSIGDEAFYGCTSLTSVIVNKNKAPLLTLGSNVFYNHSSTDFEITVPKNRLADYKNMSGWSSYRSSIEPSENISPINLYYNTGMNLSYYVYPGLNKLYAINVLSQGGYVITITNGTNAAVKLYNAGFLLKETINTSNSVILYGSTVYYLSLEHTDVITSGTISVNIAKDIYHSHIYNHSYTWLNYNQHKAYCACGESNNELHVVSSKSLGDGLQYVTCILCGGPANAGIVPWDKGIQITNNGSFISPNGILVLADEDIDNYLMDEIEFKHQEISLQEKTNKLHYYLKRDEDYLI